MNLSITGEQPRDRLALAVMLAGVFMTTADNSIVNLAVPAIRSDLGASGALMQLVVAAYILAFAVLLVTGARMGKLFGLRSLYLTGIALFTASSLACGLAPNVELLIVARVAQGCGAALLVPQVLSWIQLTLRGRELTRAIGLYSFALAAGAGAGMVLGGILVSGDILGLAWRPVFLINVPVGLVLLAIGFVRLRSDHVPGRRQLDVGAVLSLSIAISLLIVPLIMGREAGWPTWTWLALSLSVPAFAAFALVERRIPAPARLLDFRLFHQRAVSVGLLALAAASTTYAAFLFVLAMYFQDGLGRSALVSGLALFAWVVGFATAGPLLGPAKRRLGSRLAPTGFLLLSLAFLGLALLALTGVTHPVPQLVMLAAGGLGTGAGFSALVDHLSSGLPAGYAESFSGVLNTNAELAAGVGVAFFGSVFLALFDPPGISTAATAFGFTVLGLAGAAIFAAATAYLTTRPDPRGQARGGKTYASGRATRQR